MSPGGDKGAKPKAGAEQNYVRHALKLFAGYGTAQAVGYAGRQLSYADLSAAVLGATTTLRRHGIGPGTAVAVLSGNSPESLVTQLALHLLGCRSVWVGLLAPVRLMVEYLALAEVDAFIYNAGTHRVMGEQLAEALAYVPVFSFGPAGIVPEQRATAAGGTGRRQRSVKEPRQTWPDSLFQTGGTTGAPKLVRHGPEFFWTLHDAARRYQDSDGRPLRQLAVTSFGSSGAQAAAMITLFTGGLLIQHDRFDPAEFLATVQAERVTVATVTPPMLYQLLDHPDLGTTDTSSLVTLSCAGSAVAPSRLAEAMARFGPVMMTAYGLTEATLVAAYHTREHDPAYPQRLASCGRPVATARVEIRDEQGRPVPPGQVGEVWAKTRLMTSGYWRAPELTAQTLVDGWLRTGDLGYLDAAGYLYLVDRAKDMIVTGIDSYNVYSRTVEDVLCAHPQVRSAAVVGVPDAALGEAVHAVVVPTPGATVTAAALREWVGQELNELWAPRTVELVTALPLTELGKIDKKALRAHYSRDGTFV